MQDNFKKPEQQDDGDQIQSGNMLNRANGHFVLDGPPGFCPAGSAISTAEAANAGRQAEREDAGSRPNSDHPVRKIYLDPVEYRMRFPG
mgnify:CR=1 FL=1